MVGRAATRNACAILLSGRRLVRASSARRRSRQARAHRCGRADRRLSRLSRFSGRRRHDRAAFRYGASGAGVGTDGGVSGVPRSSSTDRRVLRCAVVGNGRRVTRAGATSSDLTRARRRPRCAGSFNRAVCWAASLFVTRVRFLLLGARGCDAASAQHRLHRNGRAVSALLTRSSIARRLRRGGEPGSIPLVQG